MNMNQSTAQSLKGRKVIIRVQGSPTLVEGVVTDVNAHGMSINHVLYDYNGITLLESAPRGSSVSNESKSNPQQLIEG